MIKLILFLALLVNLFFYEAQTIVYLDGCVDGAVQMYFKTGKNNKAIEEVTTWCSKK